MNPSSRRFIRSGSVTYTSASSQEAGDAPRAVTSRPLRGPWSQVRRSEAEPSRAGPRGGIPAACLITRRGSRQNASAHLRGSSRTRRGVRWWYKHHDVVAAAAALPVPLPWKCRSKNVTWMWSAEVVGAALSSSGGRWRGIFRRKPFHSASYGGNNIPKCVLHGDYMRQWCSRCEAQMWIRASYCCLPASVCVSGWQTILLCSLLRGEHIGKEFLWETKKKRTRSFCIFLKRAF